jgi:hypothetical protein
MKQTASNWYFSLRPGKDGTAPFKNLFSSPFAIFFQYDEDVKSEQG